MDILSLIKMPIVLGMVIVIQVVKKILTNKGLGFKNEDNWLFVTLAAGIPAALISTGIDGFDKFNLFVLLKDVFVYAAGAVLLYKTALVSGQKITDILNK